MVSVRRELRHLADRLHVLPIVESLQLVVAGLWRRMLPATTFVAVTGSIGKTTMKECAAACLGVRYRVVKTKGSQNHIQGIFRTLLRVRPWHQYAVVEIGLSGPGQMKRFARVVRPHMVVFLGAARTHTNRFASLEQTAAEKSLLVQAVRPGGTVFLNADNPYSATCTTPPGVRVVTFGTAASAGVYGDNVRAVWPDRLSFDAHAEGESMPVRTPLVGAHWMPSVLGGLAVARACGVPLADAAGALARCQPITAHLSPEALPNGVVFLRDDRNGSIDTLQAALRVMTDAVATRKVLVISDVSDDKRKLRRRGSALGRLAAERFGLAVFLGEHAQYAVRAAVESGMRADCVHGFTAIEQATAFLRGELRAGDLVLLKGRATDHVSRVYLAMVRDVACWRNRCRRHNICDVCPELTKASPRVA